MNKEKNKIILVGGCGFLGKESAKILKKNLYHVVIADLLSQKKNCPANIPFLNLDITNSNSIKELQIEKGDVIVNLASRQYHNLVPYFHRNTWFEEVNLIGAERLMEKSIICGASRYIYFSSDMVYGLPKSIPVKEDNDLNPIAEYGTSKMKAEKILIGKSKNKISLIIFRARLINGPGRLGAFKNLFNLINKSLPIPVIGKGENCYQMISVFDCAEAILLSIENQIHNQIFNLGSNKIIKVKDLMRGLIKFASSKSNLINVNPLLIKPVLYFMNSVGIPILYPEQYKIADKNIILNTDKAKDLLKWDPKYDDDKMIHASYSYWIENKK